MKYKLLLFLTITLALCIYFSIQPNSQSFGALDDYKHNSKEGILIVYLAKQEMFKDDPQWNANPFVQRVKNKDGSLNMDEVKILLNERGLMTPEEFDAALATIRTKGYTDTAKLKGNEKSIQMFQKIKTERDAEAQEEDRQKNLLTATSSSVK